MSTLSTPPPHVARGRPLSAVPPAGERSTGTVVPHTPPALGHAAAGAVAAPSKHAHTSGRGDHARSP